MEEISENKVSLIDRFFKFLRKARERKQVINFEQISHFRYFLDSLDKSNSEYDNVKNVVVLCEEAYKIARQRLLLAEKIKNTSDKMLDLHCFDALTEEDSAIIKDLLDRFVSLSKERSALMYQITGFDNSLSHMERLENDANTALESITDAERRQRILKHDIAYLEGEKSELEYEKEFLEKGQRFIYLFTIVMVSGFGIGAITLAYLFMFRNESIFFPLSTLIFLLIFLVFLLSLFKRRISYELSLNIKKQKKAIEMLNKKNAVYAHYTNFLNFEYRKYKVQNAQNLKKNLHEYENYKHLTARFDAIRSIMYQTESQIQEFLRSRSIDNIKISVEKFAQTVNIDDKKQYFNDLLKEKNNLETNLLQLDNRHEEIWDLLTELNLQDNTSDKLVDKILQSYLQEVSQLFSRKNLLEEIDAQEEEKNADKAVS